MSHYLGEFTCRQFARDENAYICVLRLGHVVQAEAKPEQPNDPLRLDQRDAVQAVSRALEALLAEPSPLRRWSVFHIVSDVRNPRFPATKANQLLGYRPQTPG
jgi:nucleoside-diphosphate-sugar epimerase